jgi:hypothetical protein
MSAPSYPNHHLTCPAVAEITLIN